MQLFHARLTMAILVGSVLLITVAQGQPAPATAPATTAATAPVIDAKSAEVLRALDTFYKGLKSASVQIETSMKFEGGGKTEQMSTSESLAVERPNRFSLVVKDEKTGGGSAVADGKLLRLLIAQAKRYSEEDSPATMDEILESPVAALAQHAGVIVMLFHSQPRERLLMGAVKVSYVGQDEIDGVKCDHLRLEQPELDFDLWIVAPAGNAHPVLRRIKPDLTRQFKLAGEQQPAMKGATLDATIDMKDWAIDQAIPAERFAFSAPADVQKVDSMEEVFDGDQPAFKLKGKPSPDFSLDLLGGGKATVAEHKGKDIVILDFWATWCGPCVEGLPIVAQVAKEYADKGVVFYAVNQQEDLAAIESFIKEHKLDLKVAMDKQGAAGTAFAVNGIPQTVIIGKDGVVKLVHVGVTPNFKERLKRDLDKVIAAQK